MAHEVNRYRLNYMQAYVKQYDDGSEILQSYSTDVVKKSPDGKLIRLWHSWSPSTMKQVKAYCGHYFRSLPYEDGTYEDLTPEYRRKGVRLSGRKEELTPENCKKYAKMFAEFMEQGNSFSQGYITCYDKDLKQIYKGNKKMLKLVNILSSCAKHKMLRGTDEINVLIKLYNYDFRKVWESGLCEQYPELTL